MTSLEHQLKRLKAPQTEEYRIKKHRASFLYKHKEADSIDSHTHLRVARKGFDNLTNLNPKLNEYSHLFEESSIEFDRAIIDEQENTKLTKTLRKLMNNILVPFFSLNDCHEVFEYLIYKYKVELYQPDDVLAATLPYHQTKMFVRVLDLFSDFNEPWHWLDSFKKQKNIISKQTLFKILGQKNNQPLLGLLGDKLIEINKESAMPDIYISFYTTTVIYLLGQDSSLHLLDTVLPCIDRILKKAKKANIYMTGLVLVAFVATSLTPDEKYWTKIIERLQTAHSRMLLLEPEKADIFNDYFDKITNMTANLNQ